MRFSSKQLEHMGVAEVAMLSMTGHMLALQNAYTLLPKVRESMVGDLGATDRESCLEPGTSEMIEDGDLCDVRIGALQSYLETIGATIHVEYDLGDGVRHPLVNSSTETPAIR